MEGFIAGLVSQLDRGAINRRQFCETVALAAIVYAAGEEAANAAPAQGFKPIAINHISYACGDYRKARDFYSSLLGMAPAPNADNGHETRLMFGPPPGQGGSFLIPRNGSIVPRAKAVVDHICYTIPNWNEDQVVATLKSHGLTPTGRPGSLHVYDPFDYDVQIANSVEENAFGR